jgi:hypothetical protein
VKLEIYKSLWGMVGPLDTQLGQIKDAGYDGFEDDIPARDAVARFTTSRKQHDLRYITLIRTTGPDHLASFAEQVERSARLEADSVTSHSAVDSMSLDEKARFFEGALKVEERVGIPVAHETHRQTALFVPWETAAVLTRFPELKLTADYSHWCCVCESMLNDQEANVSLSNRHAVHIHGRVGFPGGPQVNDPRAPENESYVLRHEEWWREIAKARKAAGAMFLSFDPEFGPPPDYMPALPFTRQPVCDLWDVCLWMADRFRGMYALAIAGPEEAAN